MKRGIFLAAIAAVFLVMISAIPISAADMPKIDLGPEVGDIEEFRLIHADVMTLTRQKDKPQVFEGSVHIILVDEAGVETDIKAEKITIFYEQDLKKLKRIEAEGKVRVDRLGTQASTELAVYRGKENIMELLIDPHVKDARGELSANKITIYLETDDVVAEGNVRGIVYPQAFEKNPVK